MKYFLFFLYGIIRCVALCNTPSQPCDTAYDTIASFSGTLCGRCRSCNGVLVPFSIRMA